MDLYSSLHGSGEFTTRCEHEIQDAFEEQIIYNGEINENQKQELDSHGVVNKLMKNDEMLDQMEINENGEQMVSDCMEYAESTMKSPMESLMESPIPRKNITRPSFFETDEAPSMKQEVTDFQELSSLEQQNGSSKIRLQQSIDSEYTKKPGMQTKIHELDVEITNLKREIKEKQQILHGKMKLRGQLEVSQSTKENSELIDQQNLIIEQSPITCTYCKSHTHIKATCPKLQKYKCTFCDKTGHNMQHCPFIRSRIIEKTRGASFRGRGGRGRGSTRGYGIEIS